MFAFPSFPPLRRTWGRLCVCPGRIKLDQLYVLEMAFPVPRCLIRSQQCSCFASIVSPIKKRWLCILQGRSKPRPPRPSGLQAPAQHAHGVELWKPNSTASWSALPFRSSETSTPKPSRQWPVSDPIGCTLPLPGCRKRLTSSPWSSRHARLHLCLFRRQPSLAVNPMRAFTFTPTEHAPTLVSPMRVMPHGAWFWMLPQQTTLGNRPETFGFAQGPFLLHPKPGHMDWFQAVRLSPALRHGRPFRQFA